MHGENPPGDALVDDLDAIGAYDDGTIGFLDDGRLQEYRMRQTSIPVAHEQHPDGHDRKSEAIERTIAVV